MGHGGFSGGRKDAGGDGHGVGGSGGDADGAVPKKKNRCARQDGPALWCLSAIFGVRRILLIGGGGRLWSLVVVLLFFFSTATSQPFSQLAVNTPCMGRSIHVFISSFYCPVIHVCSPT